MKKTPAFLVITFTVLMFAMPFVSKAQDGPDPPGGPCGDTECPFDGGVSILVTTAVGYGIMKMKKKKLEVEEDK